MPIITQKLNLNTKGNFDIINITPQVKNYISETEDLKNGIVTIFVPGATGGITTVEYEPGLIQDLKDIIERLAPFKKNYQHNLSHFNGNAHSHLRASLIGPSLTIPFIDKKLQLGVWQQIVFIDFDNQPRNRQLIIQIIGE